MTDANGCPDAPHLPVDCPGDACRGAANGLRQRPEDQPLPVGNDRPGAHDQLIAALTARRELGLRRYGQLLQPHNGRDTARDLVEELLDAAVYAQTLETELADLRGLQQAAALVAAELRKRAVGRAPLLEMLLEQTHAAPVNPTSALAAVLRTRALLTDWCRRYGADSLLITELKAALDGPDDGTPDVAPPSSSVRQTVAVALARWRTDELGGLASDSLAAWRLHDAITEVIR